jgi:hypothetical protein
MIDHSKPPCEECGSYDSENHHPKCGKKSDEEKIREFSYYYEVWLDTNDQLIKLIKKRAEEITFWQGKYRMVKHENNKLRRKLYSKNKELLVSINK